MSESLKQLLELTRDSINQDIVNYLRSRSIKKSSADDWEIGYLADQKDLQSIEDKDELRKLGILTKGDFSPLHKYVTFPLYNQYGKLIGLSGRTLLPGKQKRKYWHSILNKRRFLFGLNKAIESIRQKGFAIVTEGQFDVITSHQSGICNIVGTMGTALTPDQITILSRYTDKIYVVFDGDAAGEKARESQVDRNLREGLELIPVVMPPGDDVDSFIRKNGASAFETLILAQKTAPIDIDL